MVKKISPISTIVFKERKQQQVYIYEKMSKFEKLLHKLLGGD